MSTANLQPQYGPFANTEVSIYCDESRHEGQRHQQFMVIGGLWLPRAHRQEILAGLCEIQQRHHIRGEMKWRKVSPSCLPGYSEMIEFLACREDVHFRCIVVDKSKVDHDKYFHNDRQFGFWVFYWHCLKQWMGNQNTYFISLDFKPESLRSGPRRLRQVLETESTEQRSWGRSKRKTPRSARGSASLRHRCRSSCYCFQQHQGNNRHFSRCCKPKFFVPADVKPIEAVATGDNALPEHGHALRTAFIVISSRNQIEMIRNT